MNRPYFLFLLVPILAVCSCVTQQGRSINSLDQAPLAFTKPPLQVSLDTPSHTYKDIWAKIRDNSEIFFDFDNPEIAKQRQGYLKHPHYFQEISAQSTPYIYYVTNEVLRRNMPSELALLPLLESAYQVSAISPRGAAGLWQVMPKTAKHLNLSHGRLFDGRLDVVDSTEAALNYLSWLNDKLDGDWLLTLAAYNSGLGTVNKALKKNRKKGQPTDFWSLDLPEETQDYVPRLLALQSLIDAPEAYGLTLAPVPDAPYFMSIGTHAALDLDKVARFLQIPTEEIYRLNAGYKLHRMPDHTPNRLILPVSFSLQLTNQAIEELEIVAQRDPEPTRHIVKKGDTLSGICQTYKISKADIIKLNALKTDRIRLGQKLLIPNNS
ncbi:MAG: transglycosylase SLT domain-containing protein [bacterium]